MWVMSLAPIGRLQIALVGVAAPAPQQGQLGFGFDAFGDHFEAQGVGHCDDGLGDGCIVYVR